MGSWSFNTTWKFLTIFEQRPSKFCFVFGPAGSVIGAGQLIQGLVGCWANLRFCSEGGRSYGGLWAEEDGTGLGS